MGNGNGKILVDPSSLRGRKDVPNPEGPPNPDRSGMAWLGSGASTSPDKTVEEANVAKTRIRFYIFNLIKFIYSPT